MKRFIHLIGAALLVASLSQSCLDKIEEVDFGFALSIQEEFLETDPVIFSLTVGEGEPHKGYDAVFSVDGKTVLDGVTPVFDEDGKCLVNIDAGSFDIGTHTLSVALKYNLTHTRSADFFIRRDIAEISDILADYEAVCTDTLYVTPTVTPEVNTDELVCTVDSYDGDYIKTVETNGTWMICTENGLPSEAVITFSGRSVSKTVNVSFKLIEADDIIGIDTEYRIRKDSVLVLKPVTPPDNCMETLTYTVSILSGDDIDVTYADSAYSVKTRNGLASEAVLTFSTASKSKSVTLHYYDPVTTIAGLEDKYMVLASKELMLTPNLIPAATTEKLKATLSDAKGGEISIEETSGGSFRLTSTSGAPGSCTVRFEGENTSRDVQVVFYQTLTLTIDEGVSAKGDFRLRYDPLPEEYTITPAISVGVKNASGTMNFICFSYLYTDAVTSSTTIVQTTADQYRLFEEDGDYMSWYYQEISNEWTNATKDAGKAPYFKEYYIYKPLRTVFFIDETSDYYQLEIKTGSVTKEGVWMEDPNTSNPVQYSTNICGYVADTMENALKVHTLDYYYGESTATSTRFVW